MIPPAFFHCILLAISVSALLSGCPAQGGEEAGARQFNGEIVLGATFPLTGEYETYGQSAYYGANARVELINAAGGVNGKKLTLAWRDNRSDSARAILDLEELSRQHGVQAVLGPLLSDAVMAVSRTAENRRVVVMTPMASMDASSVGSAWIFRSCFTNTAQIDGLVRFQMNSYGAQTCAILYDSRHVVSAEMTEIFDKLFTKAGGRVLGKRSFAAADGAKDYETALRALAEEKPDFIFAPTYALEATEIMRAARDLKIDTRFCGPDTWDNELVFDASGSRLAGTAFASFLFEQSFSYKPFQTFFTAMEQAGMDNPDAMAAGAYDAVTLLAQALKTGESSEDIRKGLLKIKNLPLATGRITISPDGGVRKPVLIRVVERTGGRLIPVYAERYDP